MHITFRDRTVIVAGAARGIGRAIAEAFAACGAQVWACDLLLDEVEAFAGPAKSGGGVIHAMKVDVMDAWSIAEVVAAASPPAILVYAAGGVRGQAPGPIEQVSQADWTAILDANLTGAFLFAKAVVPAMKAVGYGRIVTISSRAGLATSLTGLQSYPAAKHGQLGFVKQLAQELGPFGITVNSVAPGFLRTNPDSERQWERYGPEGQKAMIERIALRRLGRPDDIANAVLFLASDYASWITGQVLPVTGGPVA
jgi:3-oxoacyl-[acyl-carrier protein] reductase